jgi:hypothetical protein
MGGRGPGSIEEKGGPGVEKSKNHRRTKDEICYTWARYLRMADKDQLFVEQRSEGDYAVRKPNSERASAVLPTQAEAIARARKLNPNATPLVERVRHTKVGKPDQWRKP